MLNAVRSLGSQVLVTERALPVGSPSPERRPKSPIRPSGLEENWSQLGSEKSIFAVYTYNHIDIT